MEKEVIDVLNLLLTSNIYHDSDQWNEFKAKFDDPDFLNALFNIILSSQYKDKDRILGISALLNFKISPPPEKVREFFPLLYNDKFQRLIAQYIVNFCEPQFLCQTVFPSLCEEIQRKEEESQYNGLIFCFYEYVRIHKNRNDTISQIIIQLLTERCDLNIECRKKALETFILQLNLINSFTEKDLLKQEVNNIMILFTELPLDNSNFPLFEYLLYFIKETISIPNYDLSSYENEIFQQIERILDFLIEKAPLDHENSNLSTTLYYIIEIIEAKKLEIPFEKVFPLIIFGPKQFDELQKNIEYFFGVFISHSDDYNDEGEEDNEENEYDEESIEESIFQIFKFDFANCSNTLLDAQYKLITYFTFQQNNEYLNESVQNCLSAMNDSKYVNFAILNYFIKLNQGFSIVFNPQEFNCYDNPIIQHLLIDFCQMKALQPSSNSIYISFLKEFNYREYINALIKSNESILTLCAYNLIASAPREFIDQFIFEEVLKRALLIILELSPQMRVDFIENIFSYYLVPGDYLNKKIEDKKKLIRNEDPLIRRFICYSIFILSNEIISAFKEDSQSFFGEVMNYILFHLKDDPLAIDSVSELLYYFTGSKLSQYVNRSRKGKKEVAVNMGNYNLFFQEIIDLTLNIIMDFLSDKNLICSGFVLFAYTFSNIYLPDNQDYSKFIDVVYQTFFESDINIRNNIAPEKFDMILRIFIKNEKYMNLDIYCIDYCNFNFYYITLLIYEFSFILVNKFNVYSPNRVLSIAKNLLKNFFAEATKQNSDYTIILDIGIIFARLSLTCSKEDFETILNSFLYSKEYSTTELFLCLLYEKIVNRVHECGELIIKLFIAMYYKLSDYKNNKQRAQYLLSQLVKKINAAFDLNKEIEISSFLDLTYGLVKETIFYDDHDFLSHPLITSSVCELIQLIVDQPIDENTCELFIKFGEDHPNL